MITLTRIDKAPKLDEDFESVCIYGFLCKSAVCLFSDKCDFMTTFWDGGCGIQTYEINQYRNIAQIIKGIKICCPEDVLKVLYSDDDFDIRVSV